jgi:hypothetical protein
MYHGGINNSDYLITNPKSKHIFKGVRRRCDFSNAVFQKRQEWCRNNNDVSKSMVCTSASRPLQEYPLMLCLTNKPALTNKPLSVDTNEQSKSI